MGLPLRKARKDRKYALPISGAAHAAAAVGCPLVVLFGKALPSLYRPWGTAGADVKVLCGEVAGQPDMLGIESAGVIDAWSGLKLRE